MLGCASACGSLLIFQDDSQDYFPTSKIFPVRVARYIESEGNLVKIIQWAVLSLATYDLDAPSIRILATPSVPNRESRCQRYQLTSYKGCPFLSPIAPSIDGYHETASPRPVGKLQVCHAGGILSALDAAGYRISDGNEVDEADAISASCVDGIDVLAAICRPDDVVGLALGIDCGSRCCQGLSCGRGRDGGSCSSRCSSRGCLSCLSHDRGHGCGSDSRGGRCRGLRVGQLQFV